METTASLSAISAQISNLHSKFEDFEHAAVHSTPKKSYQSLLNPLFSMLRQILTKLGSARMKKKKPKNRIVRDGSASSNDHMTTDLVQTSPTSSQPTTSQNSDDSVQKKSHSPESLAHEINSVPEQIDQKNPQPSTSQEPQAGYKTGFGSFGLNTCLQPIVNIKPTNSIVPFNLTKLYSSSVENTSPSSTQLLPTSNQPFSLTSTTLPINQPFFFGSQSSTLNYKSTESTTTSSSFSSSLNETWNPFSPTTSLPEKISSLSAKSSEKRPDFSSPVHKEYSDSADFENDYDENEIKHRRIIKIKNKKTDKRSTGGKTATPTSKDVVTSISSKKYSIPSPKELWKLTYKQCGPPHPAFGKLHYDPADMFSDSDDAFSSNESE